MGQVICGCGRELSFAGVVVQQCPDCGRWVSAGETARPEQVDAKNSPTFGIEPAMTGAQLVIEGAGPGDSPLSIQQMAEFRRTIRIGRHIDLVATALNVLGILLVIVPAAVWVVQFAMSLRSSVYYHTGMAVAVLLGLLLIYAGSLAKRRTWPASIILVAVPGLAAAGWAAYLWLDPGLTRNAATFLTIAGDVPLVAFAAAAWWLSEKTAEFGRRPSWTCALERVAVSRPSSRAAEKWKAATSEPEHGVPELSALQIEALCATSRAWNRIGWGAALYLAIAVLFALNLLLLWAAVTFAPRSVPRDVESARIVFLLVSTVVLGAVILMHGLAYWATKAMRWTWVPVLMSIGYTGLMALGVALALAGMVQSRGTWLSAYSFAIGVVAVLGPCVFLSVRTSVACWGYPSFPRWCQKALS